MPYIVNEIFKSLQGEGARSGTLNIFVRFSGCNLTCKASEEGFDCDTDFTSIYKKYSTAKELVTECHDLWEGKDGAAVILTGGEPALQVDEALVVEFKEQGFLVAIETNGTKPIPKGIDWVTCSPKTAEHTLLLGRRPDELKYVRCLKQGIPKPKLKADYYYLSPAATSTGIQRSELDWCLKLIKEDPRWWLSVQMHKLWGQR